MDKIINLKDAISLAGDKPEQHAFGGALEGAERNTRELATWQPRIESPNQAIARVKTLADARGQEIVQADGYAMGTVAIHRDSIVGSQYRLNAKPVAKVLGVTDSWARGWQQEVEARFNLVAESPNNYFDAAGVNTLTGLVRLAVGGFLMTGELLATVEWIRKANRPFSTAIQMVSPTRLCNPDGISDSQNLKSGVSLDSFGAPIGYNIRKVFPGSELGMDDYKWIYVPSEKPWGRKQVIHIFEPLLPGQVRGVSDMVSVLKQMKMTKNFQEVVLQNAVVNASYAAAIESELPSELVFGQMGLGQGQTQFGDMLRTFLTSLHDYSSGSKNIQVDGVKIPHLFPGTKLHMQPMGTPGGVGTDYEQSLLRNVAAGLGMSYEQFSRDYTQTNYSSARASMGETWKYMNSRKKMLADRFASHIYALWLEEEIAAGNVSLPPGKSRDWFYAPLVKDALTRAEWIGASRGQIDELKETNAAIARIKNGLSTYEIEIGRLGNDWRDVFAQRAEEEDIISQRNLNFTGQPTPEPAAAENTDDADDDTKVKEDKEEKDDE